MDSKDRAELDRLLDIAEKEQLLARSPAPVDEQAVMDRQAQLAEFVRDVEAVRALRERLVPDAAWIE